MLSAKSCTKAIRMHLMGDGGEAQKYKQLFKIQNYQLCTGLQKSTGT